MFLVYGPDCQIWLKYVSSPEKDLWPRNSQWLWWWMWWTCLFVRPRIQETDGDHVQCLSLALQKSTLFLLINCFWKWKVESGQKKSQPYTHMSCVQTFATPSPTWFPPKKIAPQGPCFPHGCFPPWFPVTSVVLGVILGPRETTEGHLTGQNVVRPGATWKGWRPLDETPRVKNPPISLLSCLNPGWLRTRILMGLINPITKG